MPFPMSIDLAEFAMSRGVIHRGLAEPVVVTVSDRQKKKDDEYDG